MAINFPQSELVTDHKPIARYARSNVFAVDNVEQLMADLATSPNVLVHVISHDDRLVTLTTRDGTWFTHADRNVEVCRLDEILVPRLMDRETVHLHLINIYELGCFTVHYSLHADGHWTASTSQLDSSERQQHFLNPNPRSV